MGVLHMLRRTLHVVAVNQGAEMGHRGGGAAATFLSLLAFVFSGYSLYESALKQAELAIYVPPVIHYARDGGGGIELFAVPITIANDGAKSGTVLSIELAVADAKSAAVKRFYSAFLGEHPREAGAVSRAFAPLSISGRATFTETVRFYPTGDGPAKLVEEPGAYRFTVTLATANAAAPGLLDRVLPPIAQPVTFVRQIEVVPEQQLALYRSTVPMFDVAWRAGK